MAVSERCNRFPKWVCDLAIAPKFHAVPFVAKPNPRAVENRLRSAGFAP